MAPTDLHALGTNVRAWQLSVECIIKCLTSATDTILDSQFRIFLRQSRGEAIDRTIYISKDLECYRYVLLCLGSSRVQLVSVHDLHGNDLVLIL